MPVQRVRGSIGVESGPLSDIGEGITPMALNAYLDGGGWGARSKT